jgi:methionine synthase II (cobalamin-independent)
MASQTLHRNPPFRAEHLGSLLRTEKLLDTRHAWEANKASASDLSAIEDTDVKSIVETQLSLGFHAITDGEYRRHMFWGSFWPGLEGMTEVAEPDPSIFRMYIPDIAAFTEAGYKPGETVICTGKIKHKGSTYTDQFDFLKSLVPKDKVGDLKLTLAAPNWYHLRYKQGQAYPKDVYGSDDEYFADIAKAYQAELQILYDHGLRNVQFDDPNLAYFCSEAMLDGWKKDSSNAYSADELLQKYIDLYNACISKIPEDMHVGVHLCRGNFVNSRHFSEGGYDRIATKLFQELNMHTYYLEYDTPRAGGFEPLQYLPKNKNVILGVITSKFPKMEDLDEMEGRVREAAKWMVKGSGESEKEALNRCGVSPQCGFASHSSGNAVKRDDMVAKLKLVRDLADRIWPGEP